MTRRLWLASVAVVLALVAAPAAQSRPPRLIVLVVVDQMRADYLTAYSGGFTGGLRRLMRDGAWFTRAGYPYLNTVTCPGHATIGTGTFPYRHGMILNNWFDRETGRIPYCTDDPSETEISYSGLEPVQGDSARRLLQPALGEQIVRHGGRSVSLSLKPRSAIGLTGRRADAVVWFDDRGGWTTSTAYGDAPVPFLARFIEANPVTADLDKIWERTLPPSAYKYKDDAEGEGTVGEWTRTFPHPLRPAPGKAETQFFTRWQRSPFSDEYLGRMAAAAVDALELGQRESTDYLAVSFSALDMVGHAYGPRSHEVQDLLVRLDLTIGRLLDHLDREVGRDNYVLGLSADHGVAGIPEQEGRGGRQTSAQVIDELQKLLVPILGEGKHVLANTYTEVYLAPAARERIFADPGLTRKVVDTLRRLPAVARVFRGDELATESARRSGDPVRRAAALSYHEGRSGDFVLVPREHWLLSSSTTTHGTLYPYDQRVPVIVFGARVRPGRYRQGATPADLAPTLASVAGVQIEPTDGRVLREALRNGPSK
ncbi:MAG TPA: alkaline phosphatase family protein [Vicinamibacterales bacterium]|nr:alkaline phosphatase family protein [Vicinamibacterales bacterium]